MDFVVRSSLNVIYSFTFSKGRDNGMERECGSLHIS